MATAFNEDAYQARVNQIPGYESPYGNKPSVPRKDNFFQDSELGRNLYNASMALPGVGGIGKVAATGGLISRGVNAGAAAANTASKSMVALAGIPTSTNQPSGAQATPPQTTPPQTTPPAAPPTSAATPTGQQVPGLSGVYKHGEGQYSDNAQGMGLPQNLGQPSAQNMQAANNLAGQEQKRSMMSVMREQQGQQQQAAAQPSFQMPRQESAYEREARMRERNSIMSLLQQPMTGDPRRDLTASQRQQMVAMLGQEGQERQSSERNLVDFARQQMSDQTQRYTADTHAGVGQQRNLIDAARLGMDQQTQGFANRAAQRRESILLRYDNAKTAQERAQIQQEHAEVFGKSEVDPYLVVPGGQQLNENGQAYTAPSAVFNRRTGDWLRQPGVGQLPSIDQNPQAIAIKNDTTMSKLQKMEALRKLGYS